MNIKKVGKQTKAFWRSAARFEVVWAKEPIDYATLQAMLRGHAAGWMAGIAWERRNRKAKSSNDVMSTTDTLPPETPAEAKDGGGVVLQRIVGRCVEVGDDDEGQPRLIIHTTREQLMRFGRNLAYANVAVTIAPGNIPKGAAQTTIPLDVAERSTMCAWCARCHPPLA